MSKVFSISEAASIAIHSLVSIAGSKEKINVNEIAEITNFSKSHLAKVLQRLTKAGYIKSERGPKGGFVLAKKSHKISLLEIYELMEGILKPEKCRIHKKGCPYEICIFGGLSEKFTIEFRDFLKAKTIADVIG